MQTILKLAYLCFAPVLCVIYWRNSMRDLDNLHAHTDYILSE